MGAWGKGAFDNDAAMDWCLDFLDAPEGVGDDEDAPGKDAFLIGALSVVIEAQEGKDDVDAHICSEALAAIEIIAAVNGQPCPELTPEAEPDGEDEEEDTLAQIARWAQQGDTTVRNQSSIREMARRTIGIIRESSELAELWDGDEEWLASLASAETRLK